MANALEVADKIAKKAETLLAPLEREMMVMRWPAQFRAIMWQAVADYASRLAAETEQTPAGRAALEDQS